MKNHFDKLLTLRAMVIINLFLITVFITGSGVSCQPHAPVSTTPAPSQGPSEEPTSDESNSLTIESWSADGVIGSREYMSEMTYDGYELYWANDDEFVYVAMKVQTDGWVALGVQPGLKMKGADMIFGFVKDGEVNVFDSFSTDDFGSHPPDTELGGTFDIISFGGKEADGYTIIEFKRALDTGDQHDNKLSVGKNQIIWAYGSADALTYKHANRGYGEITIKG
jgi:hypothetical protein